MSVNHYENFPVASWLCPPELRPAVTAIYRFARTADDLADEGDVIPEDRVAQLRRYRSELHRAVNGQTVDREWAAVFAHLAAAVRRERLPIPLLDALLDAFQEDVRHPVYATRAALLGYCERSANPVGRLMLHLYGIDDDLSLRQSDSICSALQLINFWQDLSVDLPRGRCYVPAEDARRHGVTPTTLSALSDTPAARALVRDLCHWARQLMHDGAALALRVPGRAGWELRLVVQGGLRILDKLQRMDHASLLRRPALTAADGPVLVWRSWRMEAAVRLAGSAA